MKILIVEDHVDYRRALRYLLTDRFPEIEVQDAADVEEAVDLVLGERFELVFVDVRLPGGNGIELAGVIKTVSAASMVCMLSSYDMLEYREAAFREGADHFIVKGEAAAMEVCAFIEWLLLDPRRPDAPARPGYH